MALLGPQLPLLVWLLALYGFSTDFFSSDQTSKFIVPLLRAYFPNLSPAAIDFLHLVVRKTSHVCEYFVLGLLAYRSFRLDQTDTLQAKLRAGAFLLVVALNDEFHQMFTISRGSSLVDVGYDCFGGVIALWLMGLKNETRRLYSRTIL